MKSIVRRSGLLRGHLTESQKRLIDPKAATITVGIIAAIVYGSLFPFDFVYDPPTPGGPIHALLGTWRSPTSRGDMIANVMFYIPFGFFSGQSLRRLSPFVRLVLVVIAGVALSVSMELIQFYLPARYTAMSDVYANGAGTVVGAAASVMLGRRMRFSLIGNIEWKPFVALLIASWLGYRLFPFVPVIDLHKYWHSIQPLILAPKIPPFDVYRHTVIWLATGLMLERLFGTARSSISILLLAPAVLVARIFIVEKVLSPAEVVGSVLAALAWFAVLSRVRIRAVLVAALFVTAVVIQALQPFRFSPPARPFGWIPFLSLMEASPEAGVLSFFEKVFMYGSLIWLSVRAGCSLIVAATLGGVFVLALKCAQVYLADRSPEITDVIILLALAAIMKLMNEQPLENSRVADAIAFGPQK